MLVVELEIECFYVKVCDVNDVYVYIIVSRGLQKDLVYSLLDRPHSFHDDQLSEFIVCVFTV